MDSILNKFPKSLSLYLNGLMKDEGFDKSEKDKKHFVKSWLKKRALFEKIVEHNGFVLVDRIGADFKEGIMLITYSGSLLTISAEKSDGTRDLRYESINLRRDHYPNVEENSVTVDFPLEQNKVVVTNGGKLVKTSPVFSIAIEEEAHGSPGEARKRFRMIGERISRALLVINQALFEKNSVASDIEERDDLFLQWTILSWFRFGGWEEEVFLARAKLLWQELFSKVYNSLEGKVSDAEERDRLFLEISNARFTGFCDLYKWLESEKRDMDIGLMKALEEIPLREEFRGFLEDIRVKYSL